MKVITLDNITFDKTCKELEQTAGSFAPDLVIGIKTGGEYVAERMFSEAAHVAVLLQRPSSKLKKNSIFKILRMLPTPVLNQMRMIESELLRLRNTKTIEHFKLPENVQQILHGKERILIVDDSIDSGSTMKQVRDAVRRVTPETAKIKTAVITVTTRNPILQPDFCIYNNRILIRFPWSKDAK